MLQFALANALATANTTTATTILVVVVLIVVAYLAYRKSAATMHSPEPEAARSGPDSDHENTKAKPANKASRADTARSLLNTAQSWGYQLQNLDISQAADSHFDLLVIDYALDGDDDSALTRTNVARLQRKPDGRRRLCLAYLSVGEAESYRSYWRAKWRKTEPQWLLGENPDWKENYAVRFWQKGWQDLMFGAPGAYLDKIISQGFDGVYLDKCDVYEDLERHYKKVAAARPDLAGDMIEFVSKLATYARSKTPGFLVVMQNAEGLLQNAALRNALDGVAKEELLFGQDGGEKRNEDDDYQYSRHHLGLMKADGKPVFVVEYLSSKAKITEAVAVTDDLGFILTISDPSRDLDTLGDDVVPTA